MKYNNKGYSVIISVLLIGFLLMLTTGVFSLVLKEHYDNRGLGDSMKAFTAAESAQELALLKIKNKGYGIDSKIEHTVSSGSAILSDNPSDYLNFNRNKEAFISYNLNVLADYDGLKYSYNDSLDANEYSIIPLFYEAEGQTIEFVRDYSMLITGTPSDLVWNLVSGSEGIGNNGSSLLFGKGKRINNLGESEFFNPAVSGFLSTRDNAYLILFNAGNTNIDFTITSDDKFSKPKTKIISSAQIGKYRHNLETEYDNTQFLNMLKYAVFSN